jgi:hypothetical protein
MLGIAFICVWFALAVAGILILEFIVCAWGQPMQLILSNGLALQNADDALNTLCLLQHKAVACIVF